MTNPKIAEICCGSYEDAYIAEKAGADQIELNSALFLGGLTPSFGTVKLVIKNLNTPVLAMVRPRAGGFLYNDFEYKTILEDTTNLLNLGVDGIVFGFIDENCNIDIKRTQEITNLIHDKGKVAVFHRAFDQTNNPYKSIEELINLSVDRVLTSGQKVTATEGFELLKTLEEEYGKNVEIIAGSGLNYNNINELHSKTNISMFHSSCKAWKVDPTTIGNISYSYSSNNIDKYDVTSLDLAKKFVKSIHNLKK